MAERAKTVVISDVHLGIYKPWSWFRRDDEKRLAEMFNKIAGDSEVKELVLLDDLFELWLYPVYEIPPKNVKDIIAESPLITKALQRCMQNIPNAYYMNGNHDMEVVDSDLHPFSAGEKKIRLIRPDDYNSKHNGKRHLEHGHEVDMFNAPVEDEDKDDTIGGYPLGYFITRLTATAPRNAHYRIRQHLKGKFRDIHNHLHKDGPPLSHAVDSTSKKLVGEIIDIIIKDLPALGVNKVDKNTRIRFKEPQLDSMNTTVGDIYLKYTRLYSRWYKKYGPETVNTMLASHPVDWQDFVGLDGLNWHAQDLLHNNPHPPKVVVMGHTHKSLKHGEICQRWLLVQPPQAKILHCYIGEDIEDIIDNIEGYPIRVPPPLVYQPLA